MRDGRQAQQIANINWFLENNRDLGVKNATLRRRLPSRTTQYESKLDGKVLNPGGAGSGLVSIDTTSY
jgi:hypothetical protein